MNKLDINDYVCNRQTSDVLTTYDIPESSRLLSLISLFSLSDNLKQYITGKSTPTIIGVQRKLNSMMSKDKQFKGLSDVVGGVYFTDTSLTIEEAEFLINLFRGNHPLFVYLTKAFQILPCANVIDFLWDCNYVSTQEILNSIDFPITTVKDLFESLGMRYIDNSQTGLTDTWFASTSCAVPKISVIPQITNINLTKEVHKINYSDVSLDELKAGWKSLI